MEGVSDSNYDTSMDTTVLMQRPQDNIECESTTEIIANIATPPIGTSTPVREETTDSVYETRSEFERESDDHETTSVTATVNAELVVDESDNCTTQVCACQQVGSSTDFNFKSKLARALDKAVGYSPQLKELDDLQQNKTTYSDKYKELIYSFRRKVVQLRTKIQMEMTQLEKNKSKKTPAYTKLAKELKNTTVLLSHLV